MANENGKPPAIVLNGLVEVKRRPAVNVWLIDESWIGEHEMLRDDSVRVAKKALADGIPVKFEVWPGMVHVFQIRGLPESRQAIEQIAEFMRSKLPNP